MVERRIQPGQLTGATIVVTTPHLGEGPQIGVIDGPQFVAVKAPRRRPPSEAINRATIKGVTGYISNLPSMEDGGGIPPINRPPAPPAGNFEDDHDPKPSEHVSRIPRHRQAIEEYKEALDKVTTDPNIFIGRPLIGESQSDYRERRTNYTRLIELFGRMVQLALPQPVVEAAKGFMTEPDVRIGYHRGRNDRSIGAVLLRGAADALETRYAGEIASLVADLKPELKDEIYDSTRAFRACAGEGSDFRLGTELSLYDIFIGSGLQSAISDKDIFLFFIKSFQVLRDAQEPLERRIALQKRFEAGESYEDFEDDERILFQDYKSFVHDYLDPRYTDQFDRENPQIAFAQIRRVALTGAALSIVEPRSLRFEQTGKVRTTGALKKAASVSESAAQRIHAARQRVSDAIFYQGARALDPELRDIFLAELMQGGTNADAVLNMLNIRGAEDCRESYRLAMARVEAGAVVDTEFSAAIIASLGDYHNFVGGISRADVEDVLEVTPEPVTTQPSAFKELTANINGIASISRDREFVFKPEDGQEVDWNGLAVPDTALLEIGQNAGHLIKATFTYKDPQTGESLVFNVQVDAKAQKVDWSVLENMNEQEKAAFMGVIDSMLRAAKQQVHQSRLEQEKEEELRRSKGKSEGGKNTGKGERRPHVPSELGELRRQAIAAARAAATQTPSVSIEDIKVRERMGSGSKVKFEIAISDEELDTLISNADLTREDEALLRGVIASINGSTLDVVRSSHHIRRLTDIDGIWRIKISHALRLLFRSNESSEAGTWQVTPIVVGKKREGYRKSWLKK